MSAFGFSIAVGGKTPQDLPNAPKESEKPENRHEDWLGVKPAVQQIPEQATYDHRSHNYKRQFRGQGKLPRKPLCLLLLGSQLLVAIVVMVRRHSAPDVRMAQDTTPQPRLQTGSRPVPRLARCSCAALVRRPVSSSRRARQRGSSNKEQARYRARRKRPAPDDAIRSAPGK